MRIQDLPEALRHEAIAGDQRVLCALLQVSKEMGEALNQSAIHQTNVKFRPSFKSIVKSGIMFGSRHELSKFSSFAGWLAKHRQLVSTLEICRGCDKLYTTQSSNEAAVKEVIQQLLQLGLGAFDGVGAGTQLGLQSFKSSVPATARLLAALPAATLTELRVCKLDSDNLNSAISRLTSLQRLTVTMCDYVQSPSKAFEELDTCLEGIASLTQLTQLNLNNIPVSSDMQLLPVQLKQLGVVYRVRSEGRAPPYKPIPEFDAVASLQHLTCLTHLYLSADQLVTGSSLPADLRSLHLTATIPPGAVAGLNNLHQVTSIVLDSMRNRDVMSLEDLKLLQQLSQLEQLSLALRRGSDPIQMVEACSTMPLTSLIIDFADVTTGTLQQIMQHVGSDSMLTDLSIRVVRIKSDAADAEAHSLAVHESLTALSRLQRLDLTLGPSLPGKPRWFAKQDAQHLSALVSLTSLKLCTEGLGPYVDGTTLCLLTSHLTNLKQLEVTWLDENVRVGYSPALPAIGKLSKLQSLKLGRLPRAEAQRGLQVLTGLTNLVGEASLEGFERAGPAAKKAFWAAIRAQRQGTVGTQLDAETDTSSDSDVPW